MLALKGIFFALSFPVTLRPIPVVSGIPVSLSIRNSSTTTPILIIVAAGHARLEGNFLRAQLSRNAATDSGSIGYTSVFVDQKLFDDHTDLAAGRDQNAARQSISWSRAVEVV